MATLIEERCPVCAGLVLIFLDEGQVTGFARPCGCPIKVVAGVLEEAPARPCVPEQV